METEMFEKEENGKTQDGFYQHKETGAVVELVNDPDLGTPLTNAYIRAGFVFVGKDDPRPTVTKEEDIAVSDKFTETVTKSGAIQYRRNGRLISAEEYNNK